MKERILIVDDERGVRESLEGLPSGNGFDGRTAASVAGARRVLSSEALDLVVVDLRLGDGSGLELLELIVREQPAVAVLMMTAFSSVDTAVSALKTGASDYLLKPILDEDFLARIRKALEHRALREQMEILSGQVRRGQTTSTPSHSEAMKRVESLVASVAPSDATVILHGASGTGKEVVARDIHARSLRADKLFVALNMAALTPTLIESQLFGHVRGAFTGASQNHDGYFKVASDGTLFLDKIAEMPRELQAKLLRAVEAREFTPIGSSRPLRTNARLIAASHRDLRQAVAAHEFREDLFYRLAVVEIHLPSLRERAEDIPALTASLLLRQAERTGRRSTPAITSEAMAALMSYPWPGNIRELDNVLERAVLLGHGRPIGLPDLPAEIGGGTVAADQDLRSAVRRFERRYTQWSVEQHGGDKHKAADALGISLASLYRKLEGHDEA